MGKRKKSIGRVLKAGKKTKIVDTVSPSGLSIFDVIDVAADTGRLFDRFFKTFLSRSMLGILV